MPRRSTFLHRFTWLRSRTPMRARNPERAARAFVSAYHSAERVAFVQSRACLLCGWHASTNAHTENGGKSQKGHYTTILNLCGPHGFPMWVDGCHQEYEGRRDALNRDLIERTGHGTAWHCAALERAWLAFCRASS